MPHEISFVITPSGHPPSADSLFPAYFGWTKRNCKTVAAQKKCWLFILLASKVEETLYSKSMLSSAIKEKVYPVTWEKSEDCWDYIYIYRTGVAIGSVFNIFSNFGCIHSKPRNRLVVLVMTQLVFCCEMLPGQMNPDWVCKSACFWPFLALDVYNAALLSFACNWTFLTFV